MQERDSSTPEEVSRAIWALERLAEIPDVPRFEFSLEEVLEAFEMLGRNESSLFALIHYAHFMQRGLVAEANRLNYLFD